MAASGLTSGNAWTIAYQNAERRTDSALTDRIKYISLKLTTACGSWPKAGLNMPGFQSVGLVRRLDRYLLAQPYALTSSYAAAASGAIEISLATFAPGTLASVVPKLRLYRIPKAVAVSATAVGSKVSGGRAPLATTVNVPKTVFYVTAVGW